MQIIGIGGPSQSGKSYLAQKIKKDLTPQSVLVIEMDNYTRPRADIPRINGQIDWEVPESIDFNQIRSIIEVNKDDFDTIIVEGIHAFADESLNKLYNHTIFLEIDRQTFFDRRQRDTRWGNEPEWYFEHVWNSYLKHGQAYNVDLKLSGEKEITSSDYSKVLQLCSKPPLV